MGYQSIVEVLFFLWALVLRDERCVSFQCLAFLISYPKLGILGAPLSLSVSHAKYVVSLHPSPNAAVPRNRITVLQCDVFRLFHAIEDIHSVFFRLRWFPSRWDLL